MGKIADIFFANADKYANKRAIWCDGETATYKELAGFVNRYSNFLLKCGVRYGDHIGIPMNNSIESVALIMAAANIGTALVPINSTLPIHAIKTAFSFADVKHLIARKTFFQQCKNSEDMPVEGVQICRDGEFSGTIPFSEVAKEPETRPKVDMTGQETLIVTMTSGSTGAPKPIALTQENKIRRAMAHISLYGLKENDRILAATPLYHSLAERLVILPLLIGATSVLLPRFTPQIWLNCVEKQQATFTIAVSAQLSQIAQLLSSPYAQETSSLRCVVSSSALLEPHVRNELIEKLRCDFHEMYGTSETSTATNIDFKESLTKKKSVGKPLPEAEIRILREDGGAAPAGEIGEIAVRTTLMCNSYYRMPGTMANLKTDGFFRTGDIGYLDDDGYLYFSGRKKEIIITGGINVYPQDVETCVSEIPEVRECAAFSYPDERLGEVVAMAVVVKSGLKLNKRKVQVQCARNLADFQQPHEIFFITELPKNDMGKLVRPKLLEAVRSYCENI
jgi:acyl-CoA synthetase (AMP-forming)/AMP-acid ligase II